MSISQNYQNGVSGGNVPRVVLVRQISTSLLAGIHFPGSFSFRGRNPYKISLYAENSTFSNLFQELLCNGKHVTTHEHYTPFKCLSLDDQVTNFVASLILSDDQLRIRWQLAFDVLYNLRFYYPQCQVYAFGSLLTGLGDKNSDVDLYVDLFADDGAFLSNHTQRGVANKKLKDDIKSIMKYCRCPHQGTFFAEAVRALGTRIPFVRFRHTSSQITCDISFGNRISVQNSKLLLFYLNYDKRVGPLLVFLRYWAKFHGISGELEIKQYTLSLLAIFYLTKQGIVPSIHLLQTLAEEERRLKGISDNPDKLDGWDASFCENKEMIDMRFKAAETDSGLGLGIAFMEMVTEFFELFACMDLSNVVLCVLTGDIVEKSVFAKGTWEEGLPEPLKGRKAVLKDFEYNRPLCVQDPFVLNFNVGGIAKMDIVKKFQKACKVTYEKLVDGGGDQVSSLLELFIPISDTDY